MLIPCLNEAENVSNIASAVAAELIIAEVTYEILFIDNGSTDGTVDIIKELCSNDSRIRLIVNNKNYGQMRSPTYGIYQTSGAAVVGISADFQDPPSLIGEMIQRWRSGTRIVLGVRESEKASPITGLIRTVGYGFLARFGDYSVIPGATGFGLYDREVVDCLKRWRDPEPFFRGMLVESGYSLATIPYHRPARGKGMTKNNFATLVNFALAGLASSSKKLLRLPIFIALGAFVAVALTVLLAIIAALSGRSAVALVLVSAVELGFALIFLFLGLIGEQLRLIIRHLSKTCLS